MMDPGIRRTLVRTWELALSAFVVAALTGFALRLWLSAGVDIGARPDRVRHAHSHLMYMGWATPALMVLLLLRLRAVGGVSPGRALVSTVTASFALAAIAWACFLQWGYDTVAIGPASIPLAAAVSGLAMLAWLAFVALYALAARSARGPVARIWLASVTLLLVSSGGAWGEAWVMTSAPENEFLAVAFVRLFVDVFGEGWLFLGALGLLADAHGVSRTRPLYAAVAVIVLAVPLTFPVAMPATLVPPSLAVVGSAAALVSGAAGVVAILAIAPTGATRGVWRLVRGVLLLKSVLLASTGVAAVGRWGLVNGLQIPYLHLLLLAGVSTALLARGRELLPPGATPPPAAFHAATLVVVASLLPLTGVWPRALTGMWAAAFAVTAALLPTLVVLLHFVRSTGAVLRARGIPRTP